MTTNNSKKNIIIIFGGKSGEHEVSVKSALSIEKYIDKEKFHTTALGVTHSGSWNYGQTVAEITDGGKVLNIDASLTLPSSDESKKLSLKAKTEITPIKADIVFPIIHGTNGEDGALQGLLEMASLPYVGSNVLGSAVSMDKVIQKQICSTAKIPQTKYRALSKFSWDQSKERELDKTKQELKLPLFIKPANLGSSVGISKVKEIAQLETAINEAFMFDNKIILEEGVENILEIEVSILGNENPQASVCGSINPNTEFYDYETKYLTDDIEAKIPAQIPEEISDKIRETALKAYVLLNCSGLARIDLFYQQETDKFYLNEINTLPGFTSISMYPKLWEASGLKYADLITELIELAEQKFANKQKLKYSY